MRLYFLFSLRVFFPFFFVSLSLSYYSYFHSFLALSCLRSIFPLFLLRGTDGLQMALAEAPGSVIVTLMLRERVQGALKEDFSTVISGTSGASALKNLVVTSLPLQKTRVISDAQRRPRLHSKTYAERKAKYHRHGIS